MKIKYELIGQFPAEQEADKSVGVDYICEICYTYRVKKIKDFDIDIEDFIKWINKNKPKLWDKKYDYKVSVDKEKKMIDLYIFLGE